MIASLAMYDLPWLRIANDRLWAAIAMELRATGVHDIPSALSRTADLDDIWRSPNLLLAQTCGYPLMTELRETVQLVATPRYALEGAHHAFHKAAIVVRAGDPTRSIGDLREKRVGINSWRSNTGMNLMRAAIAPVAQGRFFFGKTIVTGSHARSMAALLSDRIDVAAIDAVTLAFLRERYPRQAEKIRVVAWTVETPGLPLVTAAGTPPETVAALRKALEAVASEPRHRECLAALHISGFDPLDLNDYASVLTIEERAVALGYPALH